jgi:hypothetical protein
MSFEPPGVAGIVSSTLRSGFQACAAAWLLSSSEAPARTIARRIFPAFFMSSPCVETRPVLARLGRHGVMPARPESTRRG